MEAASAVACWERLDAETDLEFQDELVSAAWDDAVPDRLREQAASGCLLCSLEQWNEEDYNDAQTQE